MSALDTLQDDPRAALFEVMDSVRSGVLGLRSGDSVPQPMTHYVDADTGILWFISSTETDLVRAVRTPSHATYVVVGKDEANHASLVGKLAHVRDDAKLDELWSPMAAAWFKGGRSDPTIALLRFDPIKGQVWASTSSTLKFGFEVLRSNMSEDHQPDLGETATVAFAKRA